MNYQTCRSCGRRVPVRGAFCPSCGSPLAQHRGPAQQQPVAPKHVSAPKPRSVNVANNPPVQAQPKRTASSSSTSKKYTDPFEGTVLDQKYRLLNKIGEGGMAKIYKAEHVFLRESRAIKVIKRPDHRRETQYGRFLREARLARKVCSLSEHSIRVDDFGYDQKRGVYYYSMEILEGGSLRDLLRQPPYYLSPQRTVQIAIQVCDAMTISHQEGVIHRDLKPDNIFLTSKDGQKEFVKILDYGLAKPLDPDEPDFTDVGKVVGTPEYMSPEQCRGPTPEERLRGISHVDGRSDVYSLGIVLYQCLVGRAPFVLEGEPTPQNFLKLMSRQISENPKPLLQIRSDLPHPLVKVVNTALDKNPARRYASMLDLKYALLDAVPEVKQANQLLRGAGDTAQMLELMQVLPSQTKLPSSFTFNLQLDPELEI